MSNPARTFKSLPTRPNLEAVKSAVSEVAKESNVPSLTFPDAPRAEVAHQPAEPAADPIPPARPRTTRKANPAPVKRVAVDLPVYLIKELAKRAAEQGVTKKFLFLSGFRAIDFVVHDVDIMEDGRRED
jgi:hypothetical protein